MLKDLTKDDWLTFLEIAGARVPSVLVLRGTRNLGRHEQGHRPLFEDVMEIGSPNGLFEHLFIGRYGGGEVGYASVYGAPMASEITHLFGVLGTGWVIQTGVCGTLGEGIAAGGLVVATTARCGEGAADSYQPGIAWADASAELVTEVMAQRAVEVPRYAGPIWTTAALLAEGIEEIERWSGEGCIAADMETATTFAVAEYFGMQRVSILSVFDNPRQGSHLALTEGEKDAAREAGERAMRTLMLGLIARHGRMAEGSGVEDLK